MNCARTFLPFFMGDSYKNFDTASFAASANKVFVQRSTSSTLTLPFSSISTSNLASPEIPRLNNFGGYFTRTDFKSFGIESSSDNSKTGFSNVCPPACANSIPSVSAPPMENFAGESEITDMSADISPEKFFTAVACEGEKPLRLIFSDDSAGRGFYGPTSAA